MAGMGPPPKPGRRRRNRDPFTGAGLARCRECGSPVRDGDACAYCGEVAERSAEPVTDSPSTSPSVGAELLGGSRREARPAELPNPKRWLSATREWWGAWARSAQTAVFEPSDWETLKSLLPIVDGMHRESDPLKKAKLLETVHRIEKSLGGTHMERLRGRIEPQGARSAERATGSADLDSVPEGVAVLDEYRAMLG